MSIARFAATALLSIAVFVLSGCTTQRVAPVSQTVSSTGMDLNYCIQSDDGRSVNCGKSAPFCLESKDHRNVACGGLAKFCAKSGSGEAVACGGMASFCEKSNDGKKVACGGKRLSAKNLRMGARRPAVVKREVKH